MRAIGEWKAGDEGKAEAEECEGRERKGGAGEEERLGNCYQSMREAELVDDDDQVKCLRNFIHSLRPLPSSATNSRRIPSLRIAQLQLNRLDCPVPHQPMAQLDTSCPVTQRAHQPTSTTAPTPTRPLQNCTTAVVNVQLPTSIFILRLEPSSSTR